MKDGLSIQLKGGQKLDRRLSMLPQRLGTSFVKRSLTSGAKAVEKQVKKDTPTAKKDTEGFRNKSRNVTVGQLRRSVKSGLRNKVQVGRDVFLAGVWFQEGASENDDGFFAKFLLNKHKKNAFGFSGGDSFLSQSVRKSKAPFIKKVGGGVANKITKYAQKSLNKP